MRSTVLLLAGEASGDEHGARLARALRRRRPELALMGTGGPCMEAEGVELLAGLDQLAVMGFAEVLPRLPFLRRLTRRIDALLAGGGVDLLVPIDYPGFNLRVARRARKRGCPVLYYVAPKVWAWRPGRARTLADVTDGVAVILPFEEALLRRAGVDATYVGHPLLDSFADARADHGAHGETGDAADLAGGVGPGDGAAFRTRWGLDAERPLLALLPGSREQEIGHHLELFVEAAGRVRAERPDVLPVLSRAPSVDRGPFRASGLPVVDGARPLLRHADAALVKSGTGTLEAALSRTPAVVAYRTSLPSWWLARALLRTEHISLPNLIVGRALMPELLQRDATPAALAAAVLPLLAPQSRERHAQLEGFDAVRAALGGPGATERVADLALDLMARAR